MAANPQSPNSSRIQKHTNMTLSDFLTSLTGLRRNDASPKEVEKEEMKATLSASDFFSHLSLEIICHILDYLPLRDVLRMEQQCKKIQKAVAMHLRVRKSIDFTEGEIFSWIPASLNDMMLGKLISRCSELDSIYGFHSKQILKRRQRGSEMLTIPGIIAALSSSKKLKGIEVSDISLLEAILNYLPLLEIVGTFKNRNGVFPVCPSSKLILTSNPKITSLHLTGVVTCELPRMVHVKHIYLRWVKFTHSHPFRDFSVPSLQSFVMSNCAGPTSTLKYVPLITGLAAARSLTRLELVRVPFLGGLFQHIVEDSWRVNGFSQLQTIMFGSCRHAQEVDLGFLMITAAHGLETLSIQPSLTKDSLFAAIKMADVRFPVFESLHLGYVDPFPEPGKWNPEDLVMLHGLAEVTENPAMITDIGMKAIGQCFSFLRNLEIYNCPHLHYPTSWITNDVDTWSQLRHLHLRRCHAIRLQDFCRFVELLPQLELLHLEYMFREPPKGCARVGLSAGTGLGVSSALVQNNGNDGVNMDGGNHNHDDGDLNRDDNNNNNVGMAGDVNNNDNEDIADDIHDDIINFEGDDLLDDDEFDDFSDNADDLDFVNLSDDDENIDMADHISDDILMADVASNTKNKDLDENCPASSKGDKDEEKPGTSSEEFEPQPSTSQGYPAYSSGCHRKPSGLSAIPNVDSRSTCQLVDIDMGNDSDTDSEGPLDGKIKVKVESNSAIELRPKEDHHMEAKTTLSAADTHQDRVRGHSGNIHCKDIKPESEETNMSSKSVAVSETSNEIHKRNAGSCEESDDSNCPEFKKRKRSDSEKNADGHECDINSSKPDLDTRRVHSNDHKPQCQQSKRRPSDKDSDESTSSNSQTQDTSIADSDVYSLDQNPAPMSGDSSESNSHCSTSRRNSNGKCCDCVSNETDSLPNASQKPKTATESTQVPATEAKCESMETEEETVPKEMEQGETSRDEGGKNIGGQEDEGNDIQEQGETSREEGDKNIGGQKDEGNDNREKSDEEFFRELAREYDVDMDAPRLPSDNMLFTDEEVKEMLGHHALSDEENEQDEKSKSYNMRPRKRGKSLTGKKKGLVKKGSKRSSSPRMRDKSCQAMSDEIRETTKRAKEQEEPKAGSSGAGNSVKPKKTGDRRKTRLSLSAKCESGTTCKTETSCVRTGLRKRKNMLDKSTSTSDPVIEDDHIQVLSLRSKSLLCVTVYMVGVTDIIIDECPDLALLRGSACRVLKKVTVGGAPELSKVSFTQCKKMDERHLVNEVCDQISQTNRVIFLRPMREFDVSTFETMLFSQPDIDYHLCVIYDHSPDPASTIYNHARITTWLDLFTGINMELLRFMDFEQAKNFPVPEDDEEKCYRNTYNLQGRNADSSHWTLTTDIPWLRHLTSCPDIDSPDLLPDDLKDGLYCPRRKGHHLPTDCLVDLRDVISDMKNKGVSLYCYAVIVYVNLCDTSGVPTPDIYL